MLYRFEMTPVCINNNRIVIFVWTLLLTVKYKSSEHWNYLGVDETLGPVAVSIRREKLEDHKEHGPQYNYRIIFRTSEVSSSTPHKKRHARACT